MENVLNVLIKSLAEKGNKLKMEDSEFVNDKVNLAVCHHRTQNVSLQRAMIHAASNERPRHLFRLIPILQPFDKRNQSAPAPAETLWPTASVCVCVCGCVST